MREWPHHQLAEVHLWPGGVKFFGTSGLGLRDPPVPDRLVNFYRRFLRGAAGFLLPLTDALQGPGKSLAWSLLMEQAFNAAKTALAAAA